MGETKEAYIILVEKPLGKRVIRKTEKEIG
jgi:hypothetical protein